MLRAAVGMTLLTVVIVVFAPASSFGAEGTLFDGRPAFSEGSDLGYFVWRDGHNWHVRWTTKGVLRHFTGHVVAEGGDLKSFERIDVDVNKRVVATGRPSRVVVGPRGRKRVVPGRGTVVTTREQDLIDKDGDRRIHWNSRTDADIDGFDFKVKDEVRALRFECVIDGQSRAIDVFAGRDNRHPALNPFAVDLR
jgi:hypothetical protein